MYTITKSVAFSASHCLDKLPEGHPCKRLHGHNYSVDVVVQSSVLAAEGWVIDFGILKKVITDRFDHRNLNEVMDDHPTAENLAYVIWEDLQLECIRLRPNTDTLVTAVTVYETPTSSATYIPSEAR